MESLENDKLKKYGHQIWCPYCSPDLSEPRPIIDSCGVGCKCGAIFLEINKIENEIYISFWYSDCLIGIEIDFDNLIFHTRLNTIDKTIELNNPITFEDLTSILLFL